jgi:hypothetical protein
MSNTKKHQGGMWEYIDSTGVLEWGNDEAIKKAKKAYRKKYFTKQKRKQRAVKREFTIRFSKENGEFIKIAHEAKQHNLKISEFLKSAVMAYIKQSFVVPDHWQVAELEQLLSQCLNEIQSIVKQKERYSFDREYKYELIEKRIEKLESEIHTVLKCPYTIEEIVIRGIENKPSLKEQLLTILTQNKDDNQNQIT